LKQKSSISFNYKTEYLELYLNHQRSDMSSYIKKIITIRLKIMYM